MCLKKTGMRTLGGGRRPDADGQLTRKEAAKLPSDALEAVADLLIR